MYMLGFKELKGTIFYHNNNNKKTHNANISKQEEVPNTHNAKLLE